MIAGSLYLAAALGCMLVLMRMTRKMRRLPRNLLLGLSAVLLFTPWFVDDAFNYYSPAVLVFLMDTLFTDTGMASRAAKALMLSGILMLLIVAILEMAHRRRDRKNLFI